MSDTPRRYKTEDELDGDELLAHVQARRRGDKVPKFETSEYKEYRRDVLREGGLDDEADEQDTGGQVPLEERTTAEHFDRITNPSNQHGRGW
jgi:hypothetical protein